MINQRVTSLIENAVAFSIATSCNKASLHLDCSHEASLKQNLLHVVCIKMEQIQSAIQIIFKFKIETKIPLTLFFFCNNCQLGLNMPFFSFGKELDLLSHNFVLLEQKTYSQQTNKGTQLIYHLSHKHTHKFPDQLPRRTTLLMGDNWKL